ALSSEEGKQFLKLNSNALLKTALEEMKSGSKSRDLLDTINSVSTYIFGKGNSFLEARAASYIKNHQVLGIPYDLKSFAKYMFHEKRIGGVEEYCKGKIKEFPGSATNAESYIKMLADALSAAEYYSLNLSDNEGRFDAKVEYFMRHCNNFFSYKGITNTYDKPFKLNKNEAEFIISRIEDIQESPIDGLGKLKSGDDAKAEFEKYNAKSAVLDYIDDAIESGLIASVLFNMEESIIDEALPKLITLLKNLSATGGLPSGIAFKNDESWSSSDQDPELFYNSYMQKDESILDKLIPAVKEIIPVLVNINPENKRYISNIVKHIVENKPDKMRFIYQDIIDLLNVNPGVAQSLASDEHADLISELILGIVHAGLVTNNVEINKLELLSLEVGGKPILQCLQPFLTEVLKVALNDEDSDLKDDLASLLTKLNVVEHDESTILQLQAKGLTTGQINKLLAVLPDPDIAEVIGAELTSVQVDSSTDTQGRESLDASRVMPIYGDEATAIEENIKINLEVKLLEAGVNLENHNEIGSLLKLQKKFEKKNSMGIYKDMLKIFNNSSLKGNNEIGSEIEALGKIISVCSTLPYNGKQYEYTELKSSINILTQSETIPIIDLITGNKEALTNFIQEYMCSGPKTTALIQYLIVPFLCAIDLDLATVARGVAPNMQTKLNTVLLSVLGIPFVMLGTAGVAASYPAESLFSSISIFIAKVWHSISSFFCNLFGIGTQDLRCHPEKDIKKTGSEEIDNQTPSESKSRVQGVAVKTAGIIVNDSDVPNKTMPGVESNDEKDEMPYPK
ncbi:MAG: hypothetical protein HON55_02745, partial [Legionellales bacterium]|nr:hypothetical protein [Legionellales bacterium]